jgi:hypothetical protein
MHDLEDDLARLFETVRRLPPGIERHESLKEIGRLRTRVLAIVAKRAHKQLQK